VPLRRAHELAVAGALLVAALAGVAAGPARAHEPVTGAAIQITAEPPQLLLGRDAGADLRIEVPAGVDAVSITSSAGTIEDVRRLPEGGFAARFVPPATRVPQVAIVAAVARAPRGSADGWLAIPCAGQADARVRATPGAEIALTIGDRRFGPRKAGKDGLAVIPIVVPPGVREAHHGFKPIDLRVPETTLLHVALDRAVVAADRQERVRVLAWVVAPHGAARRGDAPAFEPSRGSVSVSERRPGEIEAVWTLPPGRAGEERMVVRLGASSVSREVLRLSTVPGPPAVIAVAFDRPGAVAGAEDGVGVTVRALDGGGNPVPAAFAIDAEGASLTEVREPEPGLLVARLRAPASLGGRSEAMVKVSAGGTGVSAARTLPLLPGAPAEAALAPHGGAFRSRRVARLTLRVTDAGGNPIAPSPAVTADIGKVEAVEPAGRGTWTVRWAPPGVEVPSRARIVASLGEARAVAELAVLPPRPVASSQVSGGVLRDLRGGSSGAARAGVAVDFTVEPDERPPLGLEPAWRAEIEVADLRTGPAVGFLGGGSASRVLGTNLVVRASASAGALLVGGSAALAGRFTVEAGVERRGAAPFLEAAVLGASGGGPGDFAAMTLSAGVRFEVKRR
jgi:hypothetical protein